LCVGDGNCRGGGPGRNDASAGQEFTAASIDHRIAAFHGVLPNCGRSAEFDWVALFVVLTTRPDNIRFDQLPNTFVVKPTHGSNWVQIVTDKSALDRTALIETCRCWLKRSYYEETSEWVYKNIKPQIMVEEFIDDGSGTAPNDYKLFVFDGTVKLIQVDTGRFIDHRRRLYTPEWEKVNALLKFDDIDGDVPRPVHLREMIAAAQKLGDGLDFIRADFYDTGKRVYSGELTCYPGAGLELFRPKDFDRILGECWKVSQ
jgi:hypothetical protein